eukprot:CAMPEP_0182858434 /NCGR_PEP_ID=MMETSP0034_2-20130328/3677_1 /TAXON_ID=156128 /ORGANISM="Nephroselmis pyriformis, Strain CCMP717" /LENGTH=108 /DNA_ID=CAMNT_0024989863 /DNA_START=132 /DNA_END=459 /DNA_ORIENTATION=+
MGKRAPSQLAAPAKRPAIDMFSEAAKQRRALAREKADCNRNKQYHAAGGLGFGWARSTSSSAHTSTGTTPSLSSARSGNEARSPLQSNTPSVPSGARLPWRDKISAKH